MPVAAAACLIAVLLTQTPSGAAVTPPQLKSAIDNLGKFDDAVRASASSTVRRAPAAQAVPALLAAASEHPDGYVRFRALVLLSGFNDPRARDVMLSALDDPNDRLRAVAYAYFEHNPEPGMADRLLAALDKEESEFVRPALTRALAAYGSEPKVRTAMNALVMKGQDLFRAAVIEALGDYKAAYALQPITAVSKLDGPLQEDAILALGKIGDKRSLPTLAGLQQTAPKNLQPEIAAAICLLGTNCDLHQRFILESLTFASKNIGYQELLRSSAKALAALAQEGHADAAGALIDFGVPARDPARSPIALAFGTVALRNTPLILKLLQSRTDLDQSALLLRDAFDMLEEDFEEERFFATVRRAYWQAPAGSPDRKVAEALIKTLEF
ncbi:MAG TPA: HEAT repeat domain-containing protein [Vicinamibacterales bacterium]|nr:HEAT repeat domain-containing protein [Vicinamibacterales bacterium]